MRADSHQHARTSLHASQAARLLREGHLGATLVARAERMARASGDQAQALRRAAAAHLDRRELRP
jgi:hypothetical protein